MSKLPGKLPQFYITAPQACPYLPERKERKLFTALRGPDSENLNDALSHQGFRRSQNVLYRPCCTDCAACLSARIPVGQFEAGKTQRRTLRRNADLIRRSNNPWATEDQYALFSKYLDSRHADGGMTDMDVFEFAAMIEETPVKSRVLEYYAVDPETGAEEMVASCLTDVLDDGLSMVYSFYDPSQDKRSLGTYLILDHIRIAQEVGLPYVYLGYWVPGSSKMDYKSRFRPLELFYDREWRPKDSLMELVESDGLQPNSRLQEQLDAIELPNMPK